MPCDAGDISYHLPLTTYMSPNPLRNLPSVNELLENQALRAVVDRIHPGAVMATIRSVLDEVATEVHNAAAERTWPSVSELAERISRRVFDSTPPGARTAINATGIILHPDLGPPPLADDAVKAMVIAAGEYTLGPSDAAPSDFPPENSFVEGLLRELTGAEAAMVLHNDAAATLLVLAAMAGGREAIAARGQLIDRGCRYHLLDLAAAADAAFREVGAVNRLCVDDYAGAIADRTALLLHVHPGSVEIGGADAVTLEELVALGRQRQLPVVDDLGAAALFDLASFGLRSIPVVSRSVAAGVDAVLFGHELLGGPACGVIVGRRDWIEAIRRHPMAAVFRPEQPTLAALAATLRLARTPEQARRAIPLLQLATTSADNLQNRAERLAAQMTAAKTVKNAEAIAVPGTVRVSPGLGGEFAGWGVRLKPSGGSAARLAERLQKSEPAVIGQVEPDSLLLNLRSVLPRQDVALIDAVESLGENENSGTV
jgi:L-seryl-tRNA(Ser) seleniumtransferase